jgi:carboxymethylenebutenolidase
MTNNRRIMSAQRLPTAAEFPCSHLTGLQLDGDMTTIQIDAPDGPIDGLLDSPLGEGPWPGVVIIHDAFGFRRDNGLISQRVAQGGFLALTPNMYARGGRMRCITRVMREMLTKRGRALDDILAARDHLQAMPECTGKVGIAGFCMGGGFALIMSPKGFGASAPFYGTPLPRNLSETLDGACPIVASFGGRDPLGRGAPEHLRKVTEAKNITADIKTYPQAGHSFANQHAAQPLLRVVGFGYDGDAADDAWDRVFAFFGEHLAGATT